MVANQKYVQGTALASFHKEELETGQCSLVSIIEVQLMLLLVVVVFVGPGSYWQTIQAQDIYNSSESSVCAFKGFFSLVAASTPLGTHDSHGAATLVSFNQSVADIHVVVWAKLFLLPWSCLVMLLAPEGRPWTSDYL